MQWVPSFSALLIDSGAYSEMQGNLTVDLGAYSSWAAQFPFAEAVAGLDDISGNWRRSLKNYEKMGFPTMHSTDPPELLDDLIPIARERGGWIGLGIKPPRGGEENRRFVNRTLDRIPPDLHVHGWALGLYADHPRIDSFDSTRWFREAMDYRTKLPFLTYGECIELSVKRIVRQSRKVVPMSEPKEMQTSLLLD